MIPPSLDAYPYAAARLIALAGRMPGAVRDTLDFVDRLDQAVTRLEGHTCTGTPYWRDKDTPGRQPKLYVIHRTGAFCPLHGMPEPDERIRTYVGAGEYQQKLALASIADDARRRRLAAKRDTLNRKLAEVETVLQQLLDDLGYDPETGQPHSRERSLSVDELLTL